MHEFKNYRFIKIPIAGKKYKLFVADTVKKKKIGLSKIKKLPKNHGMIFLYDKPTKNAFTMRNTSIPLKIIFLDKNFKIVDSYDCRPHQKKLIKPMNNYTYVIEI